MAELTTQRKEYFIYVRMGAILNIHIFPGMLFCEDILLLGCCHVGVDLRDINGAMSQHFLDIADIHVCVQQTGGEGMTEHMWGNMEVNRSEICIFIDHIADRLFRQTMIKAVDKEVAAGIYVVVIFLLIFPQDPEDAFITQLKHALLGTFSVDQDGCLI